jgi:SAM-dependent methyltransferase
MADAYDRFLGPSVFHPFAVDLARRLSTLAPRRILELAAGTGLVTAEVTARLPESELVATDLNPAMVQYGARRAPAAIWQQADAGQLPFGDHQFDAVICQFGVMFFPDKPAAFAEACRVLEPGGRLLFTTWATVDTHEFADSLLAALRTTFPTDPPTFIVSVPHGYAAPEEVEADLTAGGLISEGWESLTLQSTAASAADLAVGFCEGTPIRAEIERRGELAATTRCVSRLMTARLGDGAVRGSMTAFVFQARKPVGLPNRH